MVLQYYSIMVLQYYSIMVLQLVCNNENFIFYCIIVIQISYFRAILNFSNSCTKYETDDS